MLKTYTTLRSDFCIIIRKYLCLKNGFDLEITLKFDLQLRVEFKCACRVAVKNKLPLLFIRTSAHSNKRNTLK